MNPSLEASEILRGAAALALYDEMHIESHDS